MKKTLNGAWLWTSLSLLTPLAFARPGSVFPEAYPGIVCETEHNTLRLCKGTKFQIKRFPTQRTWAQRVAQPDLYSQSLRGPKGSDSGRVRYLPFFRAVYGATAQEVRQSLTQVEWLDGSHIQITTINKAAEQLTKAREHLQQLPEQYRRLLIPAAGGFRWRTIAGTQTLSPHSFGIAVDFSVDNSRYWRWDNALGRSAPSPKPAMLTIAKIFAQYGFIWGGHWQHYDTMHFEYRPELTGKAPKP